MQTSEANIQKGNKGFLIAITSAIVLSFTGILIRIISENYQLPALTLAFWRDLFVVLGALPFLIIFKPQLLKVNKENIFFLFGFGIVLAFFNIFWTLAVTLTGAAVATVLVYSSAGFTALLGYFLLNEDLGWKKITAVVFCMAGCLFVSGAANPNEWQANTLGILTGLSSGLLYAVYSLMGRTATQRQLNPWTTLFYSFLFAAAILLVINLLPVNGIPATAGSLTELFFLGKQWRGWLLLLLLAAGPILLGFGLYNISLGLLASSSANFILTLEPVMTGITAYFLLGERLSAPELFGSGLILSALIMLRFRLRTRPSINNPV